MFFKCQYNIIIDDIIYYIYGFLIISNWFLRNAFTWSFESCTRTHTAHHKHPNSAKTSLPMQPIAHCTSFQLKGNGWEERSCSGPKPFRLLRSGSQSPKSWSCEYTIGIIPSSSSPTSSSSNHYYIREQCDAAAVYAWAE